MASSLFDEIRGNPLDLGPPVSRTIMQLRQLQRLEVRDREGAEGGKESGGSVTGGCQVAATEGHARADTAFAAVRTPWLMLHPRSRSKEAEAARRAGK